LSDPILSALTSVSGAAEGAGGVRLVRNPQFLFRVSTPVSGTGGGAHPAERIAQLIAERYREPLRVADLAAAIHLHPSYAMSLFRQTFDLTIIEYLTRFRVAAAQRLLAVTDAGVLEIALDCGFGSSSRFHAAFKDACGQSPREYRLNVRLRS